VVADGRSMTNTIMPQRTADSLVNIAQSRKFRELASENNADRREKISFQGYARGVELASSFAKLSLFTIKRCHFHEQPSAVSTAVNSTPQ
jgi:hypothetical protein